MVNAIRSSLLWSILHGICAWCARQWRGSLLLCALRDGFSRSVTGSLFYRFGNSEDKFIHECKGNQICLRVNEGLAGMHRFGSAVHESVFARICAWFGDLLRGSFSLRVFAAGGFTGFLLIILGLYAGVDWALRDLLAVPVLSSLWDEMLLLLSVVWIIWQRMDRQTPLDTRVNAMDLPIFVFLAVGLILLNLVSPILSIAVAGYRAVCQYILWFFVVTRLVRDDGDFKRVYGAMLVLATLIALHGIYQYIVAVPIPSKWTDQAEQSVRTRVFSIFGSPNIMADYMVIFAPMAAGFAYAVKSGKLKVLGWFAAICMCVSCLFTMSRAGWVAMVVAIVIFAFLVDKRLFLIMVAAGLAALCLPFVASRLGYLFTKDFAASTANGGRESRWAIGMHYLNTTNPVFGVGLGMFGGAVAMQHKLHNFISYFYLDNYYLKTLVEMGYVGLTAFILMMGSLLFTGGRCLYRLKKRGDGKYPMAAGIFAGLCGVLVHCFFENIFEEPYMMAVFWILAALLVWVGLLKDRQKSTL